MHASISWPTISCSGTADSSPRPLKTTLGVKSMEINLPTFFSAIGVSVATAAWLARTLVNHLLSKELEQNKHDLDLKLSEFKANHEATIRKDVEVFLKENEALIRYQSEAKARLYHAIGPLKFQLLLAARDFKVRIRSFPRQPFDIQSNRSSTVGQ
jgi:hypothetical protein